MMHRISHWLSRHRRAVLPGGVNSAMIFPPISLTDLIQPGILHVVRDFNADVALARPR